jgi:hypothetical protein
LAADADQIADMHRKWLVQQREIEAWRQESLSLKALVLDLQAVVEVLRPEKDKPLDLGQRLQCLARRKGVKGLVGELGISERSYHRIRDGKASPRLRRRVESYLQKSLRDATTHPDHS